MFTSTASAPGKLILFGEHAVVYGATAIAGALSDLRIHVTAATEARGQLTITLPDIGAADVKAASVSQSWSLAEVAEGLRGVFCSGAGSAAGAAAAEGQAGKQQLLIAAGRAAFKPSPAVLAALEALVERCDKLHRKAFIPTLFLAAAIFSEELLVGGGEGTAGAALPGLHVTIFDPTLPVAAGLGSSAAFSVATAAALLDTWRKHRSCGKEGILGAGGAGKSGSESSGSSGSEGEAYTRPAAPELSLINDWAYSAEMLFHGSPSGLDNTVSTYGGALAYRKNLTPTVAATAAPTGAGAGAGAGAGSSGAAAAPPATPGSHVEHLAGMPPLRILVTNTKIPKETSKLVAGVRVLHDQLPSIVQPILDAINAISKAFISAIGEEGSGSGSGEQEVTATLYSKLQSLVRMNHCLLNSLGVGHAGLDEVVQLFARTPVVQLLQEGSEAGAAASAAASAAAAGGVIPLATKLTGAGGGGCALTLLPPQGTPAASTAEHGLAAVVKVLQGKGYDCFETRLGGAGVLVKRGQQ